MKNIFALALLALGFPALKADTFIFFHFSPAGSIGTLLPSNQLQVQGLPVEYMTKDLAPLSTRLNMPPGALQVTTGALTTMSLVQSGGFVFAASLDYETAGSVADLTGAAIIPPGGPILTNGPIFSGTLGGPAVLGFAPAGSCAVGAVCNGDFILNLPLFIPVGGINPLVNNYLSHRNQFRPSTGGLTVQFSGFLNTATGEVTGGTVDVLTGGSVDLSLLAPVPEPATVSLFGCSILGGALVLARRSRQTHSAKENESHVQ